jgi:capsular exopolysaccharide synthesis family protein
MAKMLEALARAQQERQQKAQSAADAPAPEKSATVEPVPAPQARADREQPVHRNAAPQPVGPLPVDTPPPSATPANAVSHIHPGISDLVVGAHDNFSPIAEQVRQIRANLDAVLTEHPSRAIVVSSPVSGDGKTLVTANLAWVLTDNPEQQVVLIDADMRKPDQNQLYGVRRAPGLSEYLRERCSLEEAIHPTSMPNLSVIPAGRSPHKPTALLSSQRLANLIEELKRHYSWVLFDTPPLLPVTDAALIARHCVGLVMVVRMGRTHRKIIERAQDLLAEMRLPVLGCVLNEFAPQSTTDNYCNRYYAHGYGEKSGK